MDELFKGSIVYWLSGRRWGLDFSEGGHELAVGIKVSLVREATEKGLKIQVKVEVDAEVEIELEELYLTMQQAVAPDDQIFLNGYQSWTESKLFSPDDKIPRLAGPAQHLVNTTGDYTFYKNPHEAGSLHAWSFTSLVSKDGHSTFWMDAAPETGYTVFEWRCKEGKLILRKDVGGSRLRGKAIMLNVEIMQNEGTELPVASLPGFSARPVAAPVSGWTSWYNYYTKIDEAIILDNLRAFADRSVPIDFFQIDDGWQPAVGDWMQANEKFPQGMKFIADQVHSHGYKAGLWLAPLIVAKNSAIYHAHRDWLLTHDGERFVEAGFNPGWGGLMHGTYYVFNLDLPEVQAHLRAVFATVLQVWGYDLVKLDFLFAAALIPHGGKSRGQRMDEAMALLRDCCGDKLILGCGVPLAAAGGRADYCRIGPDIGLSWDLGIADSIHLRERISTQNALHNTINRRHFAGRLFANDPDVFILREDNNKLNPEQKYSLLIINHIFGDLLFTSDAIGGYDAQTMRLYRSTFPLLPRQIVEVQEDDGLYRIWFVIDDRRYFAVANLSRHERKAALPAGDKYYNGFIEDSLAVSLKPYEARVYLQLQDLETCVVGSELHIFPGCEVLSLKAVTGGIEIALHPHSSLSGTLVVRVIDQGERILVNGIEKSTFKHKDITIVRLQVQEGKFV